MRSSLRWTTAPTRRGTLYNFIGCCDLRLGDPSSALNYFNLGISQEGNSEELLQEMKFNVIAAYEGMEDFESAKTKLKGVSGRVSGMMNRRRRK